MADGQTILSGIDNIINQGVTTYNKVLDARAARSPQQIAVPTSTAGDKWASAEKVGIGFLIIVGLLIVLVVVRKELL